MADIQIAFIVSFYIDCLANFNDYLVTSTSSSNFIYCNHIRYLRRNHQYLIWRNLALVYYLVATSFTVIVSDYY